jgi:hypothetical protein
VGGSGDGGGGLGARYSRPDTAVMAFVYGSVPVNVSPAGWPIVMPVVKLYTLPLTPSVGAVAMVLPS